MNKFRFAALAVTISAVLLAAAGCGNDDTATANPTVTTSTAAMKEIAPAKPKRVARAAKTDGDLLQTGRTDYGKIVQNSKGHTIYLFTKDRSKYSNCYGDCARAWPPVIVSGTPTARKGSGIRKSKLGTTKRRNGKLQATYNGHPLYYYFRETEADQVLCQAVPEFGGTWYIVNPDGTANKAG